MSDAMTSKKKVSVPEAKYAALLKCSEALQELHDMYAFTWDCVDGALMMIDTGVARFEQAHAKAAAALAKLEAS